MPSRAAVYWDTCVFIDWMRPDQKPDRVQLIVPLVKMAEEGDLLIVTSAWTLVELTRTEDGITRTPEEEKKLADFFKNDFIEVRTLTRAVAEKSRQLQRESFNRKMSLPKMDSVHLATAVLAPTLEIHTFDQNHLFPHDNIWGTPPRRIGFPCLPGHLLNPPKPPEPPEAQLWDRVGPA